MIRTELQQQEKGEGQMGIGKIPLVIPADLESNQTCELRDMELSKGLVNV